MYIISGGIDYEDKLVHIFVRGKALHGALCGVTLICNQIKKRDGLSIGCFLWRVARCFLSIWKCSLLWVLLLTYHVGRVVMNGAACSSVICSEHETEPALCMKRFQNERSVNYKNIAALSALPRQKTDNSSTSEISRAIPKLASVLIYSKLIASEINILW